MRYTETELGKTIRIGCGLIDMAVEAVIARYTEPDKEDKYIASLAGQQGSNMVSITASTREWWQ